MNGFENFIVTVLDSIAHGPYFDEQSLWINTGFKKFPFEQMINDIKEGLITFTAANIKNCDSTLFKMVTKSLALLTMFPHGHVNELISTLDCSEQKLHDILNEIWGTEVTVAEYEKILNQ